jgi:glycosyltransferase involved in cell wall biosynthesis
VLKPIGITVVVPSFNHGRFIDETILSLLDQNYPELEVLVMDGGSTDDTVERLKAYGDRISWVSEPDGGQTDAIIKGFARARHPWLTWLNSDDVQCNRALWRLSDLVGANADIDVVVGDGHYMNIDGGEPRPYPTITLAPGVNVGKEVFHKGYMAQPSVFFRRDFYDRVGGLDGKLNFCMDYDLWCRFAMYNARFAKIDADISGNRWYDTTKTASQTLELYAEVLFCQRRAFGGVSPFMVQSVSDNLYSRFHSKFYGDDGHLFFRWLMFRALWIVFNVTSPWYCFTGLFKYKLSMSGPVANDRMGLRPFVRSLPAAFGGRRSERAARRAVSGLS